MAPRAEVVHIPLIPSLTDNQKDVLDAVVAHLVRDRESPMYREIAAEADVAYQTAYHSVQRLVDLGFLVRGAVRQRRSLGVTQLTAQLYKVTQRGGDEKNRPEIAEFMNFAFLPTKE